MAEPRKAEFLVPADAEPGQCRSCLAPIFWVLSKAGKSMPLPVASVWGFVLAPQRSGL